MNTKKIKVALLGVGTVGTGVYKLIQRRADVMVRTIGAEMEVSKILVHNLNKQREGIDASLLTDNWQEIINDPEIQIVVEVMGGIEPARTMILEALHAGKHVVTANKDLLAAYGKELLDAAEEKHCDLLFEAAVAGGIPIIRPLKQCLAGNEIDEVIGIVNGTTNYILTKMEQEGMLFEEALGQAQALGYAERNPEADVEGYDACRKIAILTSLVAGKTVDFHKIHTEGIAGIDPTDFAYAKKLDATIKLLAVSRETEDGYQISVAPYLLKKENALAGVNDVFNAVAVCGNTLGDTMFYGRGAGKLPTASAVVADVVECARHLQKTVGCLWEEGEAKVADFDSQEGRFFVRVSKKARADVEKVFGAVVPVVLDSALEEFAFVTESMQEAEFEKCREQIVGFVKKIRIKD